MQTQSAHEGELERVPTLSDTGQARKPSVDISLLGCIRKDFARYCQYGRQLSRGAKLRIFLENPGLHAIIVFRFGNWVIRKVRWRILYYPLALLHLVLQQVYVVLCRVWIDPGAQIGPGLYIGHYGSVHIGPIRMGEDCSIGHYVTIGMRADGSDGTPTFGDNVWIGVGAVIYGDISIGDGVTIGPNTVVSRSLPGRTMVLGNPLRIVSTDSDNYFSIYGRARVQGSA
jgi:serine O-acetyltransferase